MNIIQIMKNVRHDGHNFRFIIDNKIAIGKTIESYVTMKKTASYIFITIAENSWIKIIQYSKITVAEKIQYDMTTKGMRRISENIIDETVLKILSNIPAIK